MIEVLTVVSDFLIFYQKNLEILSKVFNFVVGICYGIYARSWILYPDKSIIILYSPRIWEFNPPDLGIYAPYFRNFNIWMKVLFIKHLISYKAKN